MQQLFIGLGELQGRYKSKGKGKAVVIPQPPPPPEDDNNDDDNRKSKRKWVTIREFLVHRIQIKNVIKTKSTLHLSGRLLQQYLVDQFAKWESSRLKWYRDN